MANVFENRVVLITGSARGIGAATARLIRERGGTVILHGRTKSQQLLNLGDELQAEWMACDVSDKLAVQKAVAQVLDKTGKIDVLVNNAGVGKAEAFLDASDEYWLEIYRTNVLGVVNFCQAVIPGMQHHGYGRIVNVGSIRGHAVGASNRIMAYSASNAAVINLTAALAKEFAPIIAVNAVSPGFTNTSITGTSVKSPMSGTRISIGSLKRSPGWAFPY